MIRFGIKTISLRFHSQQENKVDPPSPQTGQPHIKVDAHTACRLVDWGLWKGLWGLVGLLSLVLAHSPLTLLGHLGALGWSVPCGPWGLRSWCGSSPAQLWVESRPGLQALAVTPGAAACSKVQGGTLALPPLERMLVVSFKGRDPSCHSHGRWPGGCAASCLQGEGFWVRVLCLGWEARCPREQAGNSKEGEVGVPPQGTSLPSTQRAQ